MESEKKPSILLVDDEKEVTDILFKRLSRRGYPCRTAGNGQEALDSMKDSPSEIVVLDVVVLDVKMPVMDGLTALGHILKDWPDTQVILLSGHADMQLAVQAIEEGAFGYLMKPVDFEDLLFKIEDAATQRQLESHK